MILKNTRLILIADALSILFSVVSSLVGARALGPAGRGDLLIVVLWPPFIAMFAAVGMPTAYRYWIAKEPERASALFSNAVIYTALVGTVCIGIADLVIPYLVGERTPEVMTLLRIYQINIPAALFLDLMRGMLEGTRRFGWAGAARAIFFGVQAFGFAVLWFAGHLTVTTAMISMITAQTVAMGVASVGVWRQFRPRWEPSWPDFKRTMNYGARDYMGNLADFTTLRLDQLMLGAMASNVAIGLYVMAVRLSEVTNLAGGAIASALMPEVAAASTQEAAEALWATSLRMSVYIQTLVLIPLWMGAPYALKFLFGEEFVPATSALRWLLLAAAVWSWGSVVISGLRGFGYPGLSTTARFLAAVVTAVLLLILLPRLGITGAAIASFVGYTVMFVVALISFMKKRRLKFWASLRPQRQDFLIANWRSVRAFLFESA
ncbi:MAG TPA: oligosaccharide flippase family protein [Pyrinomonadaceae bacterium]|nr:oligosaccharide flippase family protein [Pyrinomonadaceae bacterium]